MQKFPVKIDLSTFFEDERKYALMLVDPQWESVQYLQQRVEDLFDVRPVRFLTSDELFIPPEESIEVVQFTDVLKVFVPKQAAKESRRRSKQSMEPKLNNDNDAEFTISKAELSVEKLPKKRKYHTLGMEGFSSSTPNPTKRSKRTPAAMPTITSVNKFQEISSTNEELNVMQEVQIQKTRNGGTNDSETASDEVGVRKETRHISGEISRSKHKRKRCRKNLKIVDGRKVGITPNSCPEQEAVTNDNSIPKHSIIPSSTFIRRTINSGVENLHIYFNESSNAESSGIGQTNSHFIESELAPIQEKGNTAKIIFKCKLNDANVAKPLIFPLKILSHSAKVRSPEINIQENILLQPACAENSTQPKESNVELERNCLPNEDTKHLEMINGKEIVNDLQTENNFRHSNNVGTKTVMEIQFAKPDSTKEIMNKTEECESIAEDSQNRSRDVDNDISPDSEYDQPDDNFTNEKNAFNQLNDKDALSKTATGTSEPNEITEKLIESTNIEKSESGIDIPVSKESGTLLTLNENSVIDLDDEDEDVIDLSEADELQSSTRSHSPSFSRHLNNNISQMKVKNILPFCIPLTRTPVIGDIIAFKFNRRSLYGKGAISQYIAGKCEYVNRRTKAVKLSVIDASLENDIIPPKLIYNIDESSEKIFMNIKFASMIEPKLLET